MKAGLLVAGSIVAILLPSSGHSEYGDIVLDRHKDIMATVGLDPVVFPHWIHRIRFKCKACHEGIFPMQKGAANITMAAIIKGEYCGQCHNGKVSWDVLYCDRCHSDNTAQSNLTVDQK